MKKIAFIIVRYGENINGGAEVHCQMLAERLLPYYEVEVLTTTIRAFNHPDQDYTEGVSSWNGVTIRRFKPQPIDQEQFRPFRKKYKTARRIRQYLKKLNLPSDTRKVQDMRGRYLLLFANQWSINWALEHNEGLQLSEFSRN